jgi:transcriptional regulator with XRE-family HTH domain
MSNLERIRKGLTPGRRKKINARARALIAEEMSLRELRQARRLTQAHMAEALGIGQDSVSRLEKRTDLLLTTLRGYVEALGGRLSLIAEFPDREPVVLSSLAITKPVGLAPRRRPGRAGMEVKEPRARFRELLRRAPDVEPAPQDQLPHGGRRT